MLRFAYNRVAGLGLCLAAMLSCCIFNLNAQTSTSPSFTSLPASGTTSSNLQPLTVGDRVPGDLLINNIINFPSSSARINDFRGKLILIDFWGTTCSSCIAALPKIDSLQKIYKDKIQVLTVTNFDKRESVENVFSRFKKLNNAELPVVLNDVHLKQLFPHELVSHVVWIDGSGLVKAVTGTEYITGNNIRAVLDGRPVDWPVKNDVFDFDYNRPVVDFSQAAITKPTTLYSSSFTNYIPGIDATSGTSLDSNNNTITFNFFNSSLLQYCIGAIEGRGIGFTNPKMVILNVKDPDRYYFDKENDYYAEWAQKNTYTYSVTLPIYLSNEDQPEGYNQLQLTSNFSRKYTTKKFFRQDLSHWLSLFGINAKKEIRVVKCLALVRSTNNIDLLKTKGGERLDELGAPGKLKRMANSNFTNFSWFLNNEVAGIPWVFDETGIRKEFKVDMEFHLDSFQNIPELRKQLQQKYGLDLKEEEREMEMYVITEKGLDEK